MNILFIIVLITFILLLAVFTIFIIKYKKDTLITINNGDSDIAIFYGYLKKRNQNKVVRVSKKVFKIAADIIFAAVFLIVIIFFIFNYFNITPYKIMVVATNSMAFKNEENRYLENINNQFNANDIVIVKKVNNINELKLYDVISYINEDNVNIIHRIIEIDNDSIITRGDSNNISDKPIKFSQVVGVYTNFKIPKLGLIVFFLESYFGVLCIISIYYLLILCSIIFSKINKEEKERLEFLIKLVKNRTKFILIGKDGKIIVDSNNYKLIKEKNLNLETKIIGDNDEVKIN